MLTSETLKFLFFQVFTANAIACGVGGLNIPKTPEFKGRESFKGEAFHSAEWKNDWKPAGRRVAVLG